MATYFTYQALESQRASGYRNTTFALAELVDNSFDAGASTCKVIFIERRTSDGRKRIDEVLIADDGDGMNTGDLADCLKFGGGTNFDLDQTVTKGKIGKFGFGLPNASLSQCPSVFVYSWTDQEAVRSSRLVLSELKDADDVDIPPVEECQLPAHYAKLGALLKEKSGTVISWRECDRLSNARAETIIRKSEELLGKLYRYLLSDGKSIELVVFEAEGPGGSRFIKTHEHKCRPNDPLFLMPNTVISSVLFSDASKSTGAEVARDPAQYYKKFVTDENTCEATNIKVGDHCYDWSFFWRGKEYKFQIKTTRAHDDIQKPGIREGGSTSVGAFYKKHERECISFVRANREIAADHFGFYNTSDPRQRWWSVEVSFDPYSDDLLGVHNNKQGIEFVYTDEGDPTQIFDKYTATLQEAREELWSQLTKQITKARQAAWKEILGAEKRFREKNVPADTETEDVLPGSSSTTSRRLIETDGERQARFTEEEREELVERLSERFANIPKEKIENAVKVYDQSLLPGCLLYCPSESDRLWDQTSIGGKFLVVIINTNHRFYEKMILPLMERESELGLATIELFVVSLAVEESERFASDSKSEMMQQYRTYVGMHLNRYLFEIEEMESDEVEEAV
ncbi:MULTISPECIES: ATP-binding protein [unclassified Ruegeria]|uniref:ATP-binding protein n=1 Tax=unclassified Ruegeria TaxID=2625375 RepID=UPI0014909F44|nr:MULTISPECIES: ATP-binding protein [unclassified Ruegeria]NOD36655.1 hypothetical protein [Ruegeria sp. HKCCD7296]NOE43846.1 hypothetical protein [Ruegeria sp. HKCCD7319]